jgi:hypothetical protein
VVNFPNILDDPELLSLSRGLAVLTAMITPALLLSATGTFILSTSQRLGRCIDRIRRISELLEYEVDPGTHQPLSEERKEMLRKILGYSGKRARILSRVLVSFYLAAGSFVFTSVAIGVASVFVEQLSWLPLTTGVIGAVFLSFGGFRLIAEALVSQESLFEEIAFVEQGAERYKERRGI